LDLQGSGGLDFVGELDVCVSSVFYWAGVDEGGSADAVGARGLVGMAADGEERLVFLDETADGPAADVLAVG